MTVAALSDDWPCPRAVTTCHSAGHELRHVASIERGNPSRASWSLARPCYTGCGPCLSASLRWPPLFCLYPRYVPRANQRYIHSAPLYYTTSSQGRRVCLYQKRARPLHRHAVPCCQLVALRLLQRPARRSCLASPAAVCFPAKTDSLSHGALACPESCPCSCPSRPAAVNDECQATLADAQLDPRRGHCACTLPPPRLPPSTQGRRHIRAGEEPGDSTASRGRR